MKVFEIKAAETDWICGITLVNALQQYFNMTGCDIFELSETDEILEVPKKEWSNITIDMEDEGQMTIEDYMNNNPDAGIIASTAY